jgi:AAA15 family ATPase/GTPase
MYKKIKINNFRGINNLEVKDLKRINILVGKNNSGKTTVLESLFLLTGPTNATLFRKINVFRKLNVINDSFWRTFYYNLSVKDKISISGFLTGKEERKLLIKPKILSKMKANIGDNNEPYSSNGVDSFEESLITGLDIEYEYKISGKRKKIKTKIELKDTQVMWENENNHNYVEHLEGIFLSPSTIYGLDTISRLNEMVINKEISDILEILRLVEPSIINLTISKENIVYADLGLKKLVPLNVIGNGILKILSIIVAVYYLKGGILIIDEIENGFHFSSQKILWKVLIKLIKKFNVQLFASTHSIECIQSLLEILPTGKNRSNNNLINVFRITKKEGEHNAIGYDLKDLNISLNNKWEIR